MPSSPVTLPVTPIVGLSPPVSRPNAASTLPRAYSPSSRDTFPCAFISAPASTEYIMSPRFEVYSPPLCTRSSIYPPRSSSVPSRNPTLKSCALNSAPSGASASPRSTVATTSASPYSAKLTDRLILLRYVGRVILLVSSRKLLITSNSFWFTSMTRLSPSASTYTFSCKPSTPVTAATRPLIVGLITALTSPPSLIILASTAFPSESDNAFAASKSVPRASSIADVIMSTIPFITASRFASILMFFVFQ